MMLHLYLQSSVDQVFAVLPLYEEHGCDSFNWKSYVDSLWCEMSGAYINFPVLSTDMRYLAVLNILAYLNTHSVTHAQCKREVFKAIDLLGRVRDELGGVAVE